jgi:Peptidase inhibitor I78 family
MVGVRFRRGMCGGGIALAALLLSAAAANAGACDAKKAQSLVGKSESPRLEQKALELSGASTAALVGQGIVGTADYRTDRVDLFLDRKGNVVGIFCG